MSLAFKAWGVSLAFNSHLSSPPDFLITTPESETFSETSSKQGRKGVDGKRPGLLLLSNGANERVQETRYIVR